MGIEALESKYEAVCRRLPKYLDQGFVVSIHPDGSFGNQGDSLFFSGLALYALDLDQGQPVADAFIKMLIETDGGAYRHPSLSSCDPSLDGLLALWRGVYRRCLMGKEYDLWRHLFNNHKSKIQASLSGGFGYVCDVFLSKLGLGPMPKASGVGNMMSTILCWAELTKNRKGPCYKIHLGLIALQALKEMGVDVPKEDFAKITEGLNMATTDNFCAREGLKDWLLGFTYDTWVYQHERCILWEPTDVEDMSHAGVDYLVGYQDYLNYPLP